MPAIGECRFPKTKMKDKYDELRAAIAAVRKVNADFLEILPTRRLTDADARDRLRDAVAAHFRDHGQEAEKAIAAFLDARARFSFDEFPRNWPEVYYMVHSSRRIMWRLHRQHFPENELIHQLFHEEQLFFKSLTPTAQNDRSRAYWDLLGRFTGYSRNALKNLRKNVIRSLRVIPWIPPSRPDSSFSMDSKPRKGQMDGPTGAFPVSQGRRSSAR